MSLGRCSNSHNRFHVHTAKINELHSKVKLLKESVRYNKSIFIVKDAREELIPKYQAELKVLQSALKKTTHNEKKDIILAKITSTLNKLENDVKLSEPKPEKSLSDKVRDRKQKIIDSRYGN
ncbi:TPA: hypothetical protein QCH65_001612 [Enterobacter roggenkampii]|nr:hypothetical protein [Enterobacter roggenkampii]